jgi:hypothetical protein
MRTSFITTFTFCAVFGLALSACCPAGSAPDVAGEAAEPAKTPAMDKTHPESAEGFKPLFDDGLTNAERPGDVWTVEDGVLTASEDRCIWTTETYDDFVLDLEFKNMPGTNSGVIVYCSDTKNWIPNAVEVQIADDHAEKWANSPETWQCAAIFGHVPPTSHPVKQPGEWNRMTIYCQGPEINVVLNGEHVTYMDMTQFTSAKTNPDGSEIPRWLSKPKAKLATKGKVGFQGKHGDATIFFRNIQIKTLD